jgi:hypothetical protein
VVGAFADATAAHRAVDALRNARLDERAITLAGDCAPASPPKREREERFLGRLLLIIITWSIVGAGVGAVMGVAFNLLGIGPGGTGGLLLQVASWALFAHLIAGLWAGYALLTRGESREPVRHITGGRVLVAVWCGGSATSTRATSALRDAGASAISAYDLEGSRVPANG